MDYVNLLEKMGFGFVALAILNVVAAFAIDQIFMSFFMSICGLLIGLAMVVYASALKRHRK